MQRGRDESADALLAVPVGEGYRDGENKRRRGAAKPPAPRLVSGYPKTTHVVGPGPVYPGRAGRPNAECVPAVQVSG